MLVILNAGGTLFQDVGRCGATCFEEAFQVVTGKKIERSEWQSARDVTGAGIVGQFAPSFSHEAIRDEFLRQLNELVAKHTDEEPFVPTCGAVSLLQALGADSKHHVAICSGDWSETVSFMMAKAGLPIEGIPIFSCSYGLRSKSDILSGILSSFQMSSQDALYIADSSYDFESAKDLEIPFFGVGHGMDRSCLLSLLGCSQLHK